MSSGVHYPTVRQLRAAFSPHFRLISYRGVGVAVPPSYCETWVRNHPTRSIFFVGLSLPWHRFPFIRVTGDHMLLHFQKESA